MHDFQLAPRPPAPGSTRLRDRMAALPTWAKVTGFVVASALVLGAGVFPVSMLVDRVNEANAAEAAETKAAAVAAAADAAAAEAKTANAADAKNFGALLAARSDVTALDLTFDALTFSLVDVVGAEPAAEFDASRADMNTAAAGDNTKTIVRARKLTSSKFTEIAETIAATVSTAVTTQATADQGSKDAATAAVAVLRDTVKQKGDLVPALNAVVTANTALSASSARAAAADAAAKAKTDAVAKAVAAVDAAAAEKAAALIVEQKAVADAAAKAAADAAKPKPTATPTPTPTPTPTSTPTPTPTPAD